MNSDKLTEITEPIRKHAKRTIFSSNSAFLERLPSLLSKAGLSFLCVKNPRGDGATFYVIDDIDDASLDAIIYQERKDDDRIEEIRKRVNDTYALVQRLKFYESQGTSGRIPSPSLQEAWAEEFCPVKIH